MLTRTRVRRLYVSNGVSCSDMSYSNQLNSNFPPNLQLVGGEHGTIVVVDIEVPLGAQLFGRHKRRHYRRVPRCTVEQTYSMLICINLHTWFDANLGRFVATVRAGNQRLCSAHTTECRRYVDERRTETTHVLRSNKACYTKRNTP